MVRCRGWTVIEVLVVIAISALLVGILIPAASRAKKDEEQKVLHKIQDRFSVVYTQEGDYGVKTVYRFQIIKDKETEQEYIVLFTNDGICITPRIPAK